MATKRKRILFVILSCWTLISFSSSTLKSANKKTFKTNNQIILSEAYGQIKVFDNEELTLVSIHTKADSLELLPHTKIAIIKTTLSYLDPNREVFVLLDNQMNKLIGTDFITEFKKSLLSKTKELGENFPLSFILHSADDLSENENAKEFNTLVHKENPLKSLNSILASRIKQTTEAASRTRKLTIIIIDDDPFIIKLYPFAWAKTLLKENLDKTLAL